MNIFKDISLNIFIVSINTGDWLRFINLLKVSVQGVYVLGGICRRG